MAARAPRRPWFQFTLRTFLLTVLALAICLGWYVSRARRQEALYRAIYRSNSHAYYDFQITDGEFDLAGESWAPRWLHERLGNDFFHPVVQVHFWDDIQEGRLSPGQVDGFCQRLDAFPALDYIRLEYGTDERLIGIGRCRQLRRLEILRGWNITDRGIAALRDLSSLQELAIGQVTPSSEGLRVIGQLPRLEILTVGGGNVTDHTLTHLTSLQNLKELHIEHYDGRITDAGLRELAEMPKLEVLHVYVKSISDDGLSSLARLSNLRELELQVSRWQVSDSGIARLATLSRLESVRLAGIPVEHVEALQRALPACQVHASGRTGSTAY